MNCKLNVYCHHTYPSLMRERDFKFRFDLFFCSHCSSPARAPLAYPTMHHTNQNDIIHGWHHVWGKDLSFSLICGYYCCLRFMRDRWSGSLQSYLNSKFASMQWNWQADILTTAMFNKSSCHSIAFMWGWSIDQLWKVHTKHAYTRACLPCTS
jgi:hypothetical protein